MSDTMLGTDELSRPVTTTLIDGASTTIDRLVLLSSIEGVFQPYFKQLLKDVQLLMNETSIHLSALTRMRQQQRQLSDAIMELIEPAVGQIVTEAVHDLEQEMEDKIRDAVSDEVSDSVNDKVQEIVSDEVTDALSDLRIVRR
jgi:type VI protein secretion system component VasK